LDEKAGGEVFREVGCESDRGYLEKSGRRPTLITKDLCRNLTQLVRAGSRLYAFAVAEAGGAAARACSGPVLN
jgi:hypothetical protein